MNVITFSQHAILWNGQSVTDSALHTLLSEAGAMNPAPIIVLDTAHAPDCLGIAKLQDKIDNIVDCKQTHICALGTEAEWRKAPALKVSNGIE